MIRSITFQGTPLTLLGRNISCGSSAPNFTIHGGDLNPIHLSDFEDKVKIITTFPSLDTPVCDLQLKEFNKRATALSEDVVVIAISKDLPFAQKRFCNEFVINNVLVFSDYNTSSFGFQYGLFIKELNLLARSVMILDKKNIIRYIAVSDELASAPNYDEAIEKLDEVIHRPSVETPKKTSASCVPCQAGVAPLDSAVIEKKMKTISSEWQLSNNTLKRCIKTEDYASARLLLTALSLVADDQGHHPDLTLSWNALTISLTTHAVQGLTDNDFILAGIVDSYL